MTGLLSFQTKEKLEIEFQDVPYHAITSEAKDKINSNFVLQKRKLKRVKSLSREIT